MLNFSSFNNFQIYFHSKRSLLASELLKVVIAISIGGTTQSEKDGSAGGCHDIRDVFSSWVGQPDQSRGVRGRF